MTEKDSFLTLVSYKFVPAKMGGEYAHIYFHNFLSHYFSVTVVSSESNEEFQRNLPFNFEFIRLFKKSITPYIPLSYLFSLYHILKKRNVKLLMCSHPYLGITSYVLSRLTGSTLISYSHNIESERFKSFNKWWSPILFYYEKWILSVSEISFFVTEEDRQWAIKNYKLNELKTKVSPFGINLKQAPIKDPNFKKELQVKYSLTEDTKILYFVGTFPYEPNNQAVKFILEEINPRLTKLDLVYKIFIIGKSLNAETQTKIQNEPNIIYLGYVEDIREILDSADIMLNPMLLGGGIKTKAVEALGHNIKVVSSTNGSFGLDKESCEGMLFTSDDNDWEQFVADILKAHESQSKISPKFYEHYYWGNVTRRVRDNLVPLF